MSGYLQGTAFYASQGQAASNFVQQPAPPATATLTRALSRADELNSRLTDLTKAAEEIAIAIGGPWPCDPAGQVGRGTEASQPAAMIVLNDRLDASHVKVAQIEQAVHAIRRSLGA